MRKFALSLFLFAVASWIGAWIWLDTLWLRNTIFLTAVIAAVIAIILLITSLQKPKYAGIRRLILINHDGERDMEWAIENATSILIGRGSRRHHVDVDLAEHRYAAFVSDSHAVMNRMGSDWYIEDLGARNGVGVKKSGDDYNYRIQPGKPYRVEIGDMIYIGKIRLLAK